MVQAVQAGCGSDMSEEVPVEEPLIDAGAALAAFHFIDSDHDRYITQGDLLRTFGMHLDKRAMQRMLEKIDWRTNRMNFENFQLLLADNLMSDKERNVLEYTKALEHISKKGEFVYKKAGAEEKAAAEYVAAEKAAAEKAVAEKAVAEKVAAVKKVDNKDDEDGEFDLCDDLWDENERSPWKSPATRKTEAAAEKAAAFAAGKALQEEAFSWEAFVEVVCTLRKETPTISNKGILTAIKSQYEAWPVGDKEVRDAISLLLEKAAAEKAAAKKATAKKAELPEEPTSPAERRQFTPPQSSSWADEKAAAEKAAAETAAAEKAAVEYAAAEKAAAEKAAAERAAAEEAAAEKADRKSTRLNSSHKHRSRMPSSA